MIDQEPRIAVGIMEGRPAIRGCFVGRFDWNGRLWQGPFTAQVVDGQIELRDEDGGAVARGHRVALQSTASGPFALRDVTIGIGFHWQRDEEQIFLGDLTLTVRDGLLTAINHLPLEDYLASVIASEMSADAPASFLQAHAITSRSWLVAMLQRAGTTAAHPADRPPQDDSSRTGALEEVCRWYDREDHVGFDVCADDHCQRYQGISKSTAPGVAAAIQATQGVFLTYDGAICDARFSKACGGFTEPFETTWQPEPVPYLPSIRDAVAASPPLVDETSARDWILARPPAFCDSTDQALIERVLPSFDQETRDFYRWTVVYPRRELEDILGSKSGLDWGTLLDLTPIERGPSGRIIRLRIQGTRRTMTVGKELEIRRWLSPSHLYSSAFVVEIARDAAGIPEEITLRGAGWGHGVGLCQIGAAVMATHGYSHDQILAHYFPGTELRQLYRRHG